MLTGWNTAFHQQALGTFSYARFEVITAVAMKIAV
jgi:hypothetical protein